MTKAQQRKMVRQLHAARVAQGLCRHCGGMVPCWSYYGDAKLGVRWRELPRAERERLERERPR